jgi:membrane-bound lytic murein transglycosylase MltF
LVISIFTITKTNSGDLKNADLFFYENLYSKYKPIKSNKLKERKIFQIKNKLLHYIHDVDSVKYFRYLNDDHLILMDSIKEVYRIPEDIYYRQKLKESWFISDAISVVGAKGYSQIMYSTYNYFKDTLKLTDPTRENVYENILLGGYYMRYLKDKIDILYKSENLSEKEKWIFVLAAYNAGLGSHRLALTNYKETKGYVRFIMKYRNREIT